MEMRLRDLREDHDLTQKELGEAINLPQRTYSSYETGNRMIPPEVLCALADFYGVSVDSVSYTHLDVYKRQLLLQSHVRKREAGDDDQPERAF